MTTPSLQEIWADLASKGYETDKLSVHSYGEVYEEILAPYRHTAINVLEIGVFKGHSLRMWERYFTMANVYGIDCSDQPHGGMADLRPLIASGQHRIVIADATNENEVEKHFKGIEWDVVIEDGNHRIESQIKTVEIFSKRMAKGGVMVIEDLQDVYNDRKEFEKLPYNVTVIDLRDKKGRYDDTLAIIYF